MRRIKEVLRLKYELGLGQRQIARSCSIGQSTVHDYLRRAEVAGLRWPLTEEWDDGRIERSCSDEQSNRLRHRRRDLSRTSRRYTTSSDNTGT
jgi:transposase